MGFDINTENISDKFCKTKFLKLPSCTFNAFTRGEYGRLPINYTYVCMYICMFTAFCFTCFLNEFHETNNIKFTILT